MAQAIWQFVSNTGYRHKIGLYHGDTSKHLLIYCGNKVVKVDFSVKTQETYTFFVDDELCNITLHPEPNGTFTYSFGIDKHTDTPLNQERKATARRYNHNHILGIFGFILAISLVVWGTTTWQKKLTQQHSGFAPFMYFPSAQIANTLAASGQHATATLSPLPDKGLILLSFSANGSELVSKKFQLNNQKDGSSILPNGFDLHHGDSYQIMYDPGQPTHFAINFNAPSQMLIARFYERALATEARRSPNTPQENACFTGTVRDERGWADLLHIINQYVPKSQNATHNLESYAQLRSDPVLLQSLARACIDH